MPRLLPSALPFFPLLCALLACAVSGCAVNPVPTPEKSTTSLDNNADDAQGGMQPGTGDSTKSSGTDAASTADVASDDTAADIATDATAATPTDAAAAEISP